MRNFTRALLAIACTAFLIEPDEAFGEERVWSTPPRCPTTAARLVVVGDSLADGLWGAFYRRYTKCNEMEVVRMTAISDGLAKSSPEEWISRVERDSLPGDIYLVQMGANDLTNIREGRERHVVGSDGWSEAYTDRIGRLAAALKTKGKAVFWFGLPVVGRSDIRDDLDALTAMQASAISSAGVTYVDVYERSKFGSGDYTLAATVDGATQKVRADDRVHFTTIGYELVAEAVLNDLETLLVAQDQEEAIDGLALQ